MSEYVFNVWRRITLLVITPNLYKSSKNLYLLYVMCILFYIIMVLYKSFKQRWPSLYILKRNSGTRNMTIWHLLLSYTDIPTGITNVRPVTMGQFRAKYNGPALPLCATIYFQARTLLKCQKSGITPLWVELEENEICFLKTE